MGGKAELLLEIDGPDIHPETVPTPLPYLELATSWFRLATRLADASGQRLRLQGLQVRDKCLAFASTPSNQRLAQAVAARTVRIVSGDEDPPEGIDRVADDVRGRVRALVGHTVAVRVGPWVQPLVAPAEAGPEDTWERTELRVQPIRVGGVRTMAKLASRSERVAFTVAVPHEEHARLLGGNLYRDVDVELRLRRAPDDTITGGEVLDVHTIDATDAAQAIESWRTWFKENAGEWDDVDNILAELGRGN